MSMNLPKYRLNNESEFHRKNFSVENLPIHLCDMSLYNGNFTAGNVSKK